MPHLRPFLFKAGSSVPKMYLYSQNKLGHEKQVGHCKCFHLNNLPENWFHETLCHLCLCFCPVASRCCFWCVQIHIVIRWKYRNHHQQHTHIILSLVAFEHSVKDNFWFVFLVFKNQFDLLVFKNQFDLLWA